MFDLKGKTALVTGSGQGIGKSTALLLATHGAKVIINWRSRDEIAMETLKELDEMGADYITWKYDLSSATIREDFEAWAKENAISVDILVLNASVQVRNDWEDISFEEFDTATKLWQEDEEYFSDKPTNWSVLPILPSKT